MRFITAIGRGNMKRRKSRGNQMILDISVPNRKRTNPIIRKKIEKPEMEKM
jgi:hypothetical protein